MSAKIAFSSSANDFPWHQRRMVRPIIERIKAIYFQKSLIVAMKTRNVLIAEGAVLTREMINKGLKL